MEAKGHPPLVLKSQDPGTTLVAKDTEATPTHVPSLHTCLQWTQFSFRLLFLSL